MVAAGVGPSLVAAGREDAAGFFLAGLTGDQEVPPVDTAAQGGAQFALDADGNLLHYSLAVRGLEDTLMAHIHRGAVDENGPVVAWLYPAPEQQSPQPLGGSFTGVLASDIVHETDLVGPLEGESLATLVDEMTAGKTYVNVHTEANQAGEIRSQILPLEAVVASVDEWQPAAETATPTETDSSY